MRCRGFAGAVLLIPALVALGGCSSCDSGSTPPTGSAAPSAQLPTAPTVVLVPTVSSKTMAPWPKQTKALGTEQVEALLQQTEGGRIQLPDAGLEPRAVRRYALKAGQAHTLMLELDLGMKVNLDGETTIPPVPALTAEVELTTLDVADGLGRIQITINKAAVRSRGDADADVMEQIGPLVAKLPGIRATMRITTQGIRARAPVPPKETPVELWQLWTSIGEAVADAIVAFPGEPIGAGAKWTVFDRQQRAGVVMLRKTDMTLLDITDGDLRLSGELIEAAIAGSAHDPALPKEITLEVLEGVTVGKRRHTLRGAELWPLAALTELSSDLSLRATATAGHFADTKTSKVKLTQILKSVRADAMDAGSPP
jgi:hypothetical protein